MCNMNYKKYFNFFQKCFNFSKYFLKLINHFNDKIILKYFTLKIFYFINK